LVKAVLKSDGGARGNPGPAGAGFVLLGDDGAIKWSGGRYLGETTNNIAEYEALIWGLEVAYFTGVTHITVCADSELVVKQINGEYRVKHANLKPLHQRALALLARFKSSQVTYIPRERNKEADSLVNEAIDARSEVGNAPSVDDIQVSDTLF